MSVPVDVHNITPIALPPNWSSHLDEATGRYYFVDHSKNPAVVTWEDPRNLPPPSYHEATSQTMETIVIPPAINPNTQVAIQPTAKDAPPVIGPNPFGEGPGVDGMPHKGWIACLDVGSGQFFYVDRCANPPFVTWDNPATAIVEQGPEGKALPVPTAQQLNPKPQKTMDDLLAPIKPFEFVKTPYQPPPPRPSEHGPPMGAPPPMTKDPFKKALESLSTTTMVGGGGRPAEIRYDDPRYQSYNPTSPPGSTSGPTATGAAATAIMLGGLAPAALAFI